MNDCTHPGYALREGQLVCVSCGEASPSPKWPEQVYGTKAVEEDEVENKGRFWPSESKRRKTRAR